MPAISWQSLESGLKEAKAQNKPAVAVFAIKPFFGPAALGEAGARKCLLATGAVLIKVLPPELPAPQAGATPEQHKALAAAHQAANKKHGELLAQYGVTALITMVVLTPEGEVVCRLPNATSETIQQTLATLPKLLADFKAAKAKAEADRKAQEPPPAR